LERLGLAGVVTEVLDRTWMLPAVGQGALGIECRSVDDTTRQLLAALDDAQARQAVEAERSVLFHLGGGCQVPLGAFARVDGDTLTLRAAVLTVDGTRRVAGEESGPAGGAVTIGRRLADQLKGQGAAELLRSYGGVSVSRTPAAREP
jgi:hydroxymethylbilane synthase